MFTKKTDFKKMKSAAVISAYKRSILFFWCLHGIAAAVMVLVLAAVFLQKLNGVNALFFELFLCVLHYLFYTGRKYQLHLMERILTQCCDPVKLEKVIRAIPQKGKKQTYCQLTLARAQFYAGKFEESLSTLQSMTRPKEKTSQIFIYYSTLASCYEELEQFEMIVDVREKVKKLLIGQKDGSAAIQTGHQLLKIIDGILTFHQGSYRRCYEIYEELFDLTSFPLSRMTVLIKFARIDQMTGAVRSSIESCEHILESGGTTFYKKRAEEILKLCRPDKHSDVQTDSDKTTEDKNGAE